MSVTVLFHLDWSGCDCSLSVTVLFHLDWSGCDCSLCQSLSCFTWTGQGVTVLCVSHYLVSLGQQNERETLTSSEICPTETIPAA